MRFKDAGRKNISTTQVPSRGLEAGRDGRHDREGFRYQGKCKEQKAEAARQSQQQSTEAPAERLLCPPLIVMGKHAKH